MANTYICCTTYVNYLRYLRYAVAASTKTIVGTGLLRLLYSEQEEAEAAALAQREKEEAEAAEVAEKVQTEYIPTFQLSAFRLSNFPPSDFPTFRPRFFNFCPWQIRTYVVQHM